MGDDKEDVDDVESKTEKKCDYPFDKVSFKTSVFL